jgi:hypothetical protein
MLGNGCSHVGSMIGQSSTTCDHPPPRPPVIGPAGFHSIRSLGTCLVGRESRLEFLSRRGGGFYSCDEVHAICTGRGRGKPLTSCHSITLIRTPSPLPHARSVPLTHQCGAAVEAQEPSEPSQECNTRPSCHSQPLIQARCSLQHLYFHASPLPQSARGALRLPFDSRSTHSSLHSTSSFSFLSPRHAKLTIEFFFPVAARFFPPRTCRER